MADGAIPPNLAEAFGVAVICLEKDFDPAQPGSECVPIDGKCRPISEVCELVGVYNDTLPKEDADRLFSQMRAQHDDLRADLRRAETYAVGARCLLRLMDDRIADYKRREELRRQRGA
jgi:hypothetical protein